MGLRARRARLESGRAQAHKRRGLARSRRQPLLRRRRRGRGVHDKLGGGWWWWCFIGTWTWTWSEGAGNGRSDGGREERSERRLFVAMDVF